MESEPEVVDMTVEDAVGEKVRLFTMLLPFGFVVMIVRRSGFGDGFGCEHRHETLRRRFSLARPSPARVPFTLPRLRGSLLLFCLLFWPINLRVFQHDSVFLNTGGPVQRSMDSCGCLFDAHVFVSCL